jgi:hypothetical protein
MEEKNIEKLGGWKLHSLSHAGRFVLTKYVILTLPMYYIGAQTLPKIIIKKLVSEIRQFF